MRINLYGQSKVNHSDGSFKKSQAQRAQAQIMKLVWEVVSTK